MARDTRFDCMKGIGITTVVLLHLWSGPGAQYFYLWPMLLFFICSGYFFKVDPDLGRFLRSKSVSLLIPYACWILLLGIPFLLTAGGSTIEFFMRAVYAGRLLDIWFVPFWFVPCLFLTYQITNLLLVKCSGLVAACIAACMMVAAHLTQWLYPALSLPWSANACLYTVPVLMFGHALRERRWPTNTPAVHLVTAFAIAAIHYKWVEAIDLFKSTYGTPVLGFVLGVAMLGSLLSIVDWASRVRLLAPLYRLTVQIGRASLAIFYVHLPLTSFLSFKDIELHPFVFVAIGVFAGLAVHTLFARSPLLSSLFLGQRPRGDAAAAAGLAVQGARHG